MTPEEWQTKIAEAQANNQAKELAAKSACSAALESRLWLTDVIVAARQELVSHLINQYKPTGETVTMLDGRIAAVRWKTSRDILLVFAAPCNHSLTPMILSERDLASIYVNRRSGRMTDVNYRGIDLIEGVMPSLGDRILPPDPSVK